MMQSCTARSDGWRGSPRHWRYASRGDGNAAGDADAPGNQSRIDDLADTDRQVDALSDEIDEVIAHHQLDLNLGVQFEEIPHARRDVQPTERHGNAEPKPSEGSCPPLPDRVLGFGDSLERVARQLVEMLAVIGQADRYGSKR